MSSKTTISDIARVAGTSLSAVSFVLNGKADKHRISHATQTRIRSAIQSTGYQPDPVYRDIALGRSATYFASMQAASRQVVELPGEEVEEKRSQESEVSSQNEGSPVPITEQGAPAQEAAVTATPDPVSDPVPAPVIPVVEPIEPSVVVTPEPDPVAVSEPVAQEVTTSLPESVGSTQVAVGSWEVEPIAAEPVIAPEQQEDVPTTPPPATAVVEPEPVVSPPSQPEASPVTAPAEAAISKPTAPVEPVTPPSELVPILGTSPAEPVVQPLSSSTTQQPNNSTTPAEGAPSTTQQPDNSTTGAKGASEVVSQEPLPPPAAPVVAAEPPPPAPAPEVALTPSSSATQQPNNLTTGAEGAPEPPPPLTTQQPNNLTTVAEGAPESPVTEPVAILETEEETAGDTPVEPPAAEGVSSTTEPCVVPQSGTMQGGQPSNSATDITNNDKL